MSTASASNVVAFPAQEASGAEVRVTPRKRLPCTFEGCIRPRHAKKLCDPHYAQLTRTGTTWPLSPTKGRRPGFVALTNLPCAFEGCINLRAVGEHCDTHRWQARHGRPLSPLWQHAKLSVCRVCKDPGKPRTPQFFRNGNNSSGLSGTCRECTMKKGLRKRLEQFGVDASWYEATLAAQGGGCAICKTTNPGGVGKRFRLDHDHATGQLRGLLCNVCNVSIGLLGDSVSTLESAIAYLRKFGRS